MFRPTQKVCLSVKIWTDLLKAPEYLSPSSIATFRQCPLKYKFSRIDGITEPPTEATLLGTFVHEVLENFYSQEPHLRNAQLAKSLLAEIWTKYADDVAKVLRNNPETLRNFRWRAWWCVENVMKMEDFSSLQFDGIETELNAEIDGVRIKGFVDRWVQNDDKIVIADYKTGKVPRAPWQDDKFDQLLIYGIILSEMLQKPLGSVELLYIAHGKSLTKTPTEDDIARVKAEIVETRKAIDERCESGVFEATPSNLCSWCHYKTICPEWS